MVRRSPATGALGLTFKENDIMQMTGNIILITGGTSDIGRGLAEAFHRFDNQVLIAGRRQSRLDEITEANPGMLAFQLDVRDPVAIEAFAARIRDKVPELNVLVNNAGISRPESLAGRARSLYRARHRRDQHHERAANDGGFAPGTEGEAECGDHHDDLRPRLRAP
ncbi:SDR family NAD(P)-dependent oxidoreductase [Rhizobium mongolense]